MTPNRELRGVTNKSELGWSFRSLYRLMEYPRAATCLMCATCLLVLSCSQPESGVVFKLDIDTGAPEQIYLGQSIDMLLDSGIIEEEEYSDDYIWLAAGAGPLRHVSVSKSEDDDVVQSVGLVLDSDRDCEANRDLARDLLDSLVSQYGTDYQITEGHPLTSMDSVTTSTRPCVVWTLRSGVIISLRFSPCGRAASLKLGRESVRSDVLLVYSIPHKDPDASAVEWKVSEYWTRENLWL